MFCKNLFSVISLALFIFICNTAFAACPSYDLTGDCFVDYEDFALMDGQWLNGYDCNDLTEMASQWLTEGIIEIVWVSISEPNFTGEMSKYEMTNAQYAEYLNSAMNANEITVYNDVVFASDDSSHSEPYFDTYAADSDSQITYSGGIFSVRSRDGYSMANHPVVEVSWFGATAFCNYYGYRLPTEWEWQAVADYDGSYTYGCDTTIDNSKANYDMYNPLDLSSYPYTSPVNHYSAYGYGIHDLAGNVWEWTNSIYFGSYNRAIRGGSWHSYDFHCTVSTRGSVHAYFTYYDIGFRVCR